MKRFLFLFLLFISFSGVFWLSNGIITSKSCIAAKNLNYMKYKVTKLTLDQDLWEGSKKARLTDYLLKKRYRVSVNITHISV